MTDFQAWLCDYRQKYYTILSFVVFFPFHLSIGFYTYSFSFCAPSHHICTFLDMLHSPWEICSNIVCKWLAHIKNYQMIFRDLVVSLQFCTNALNAKQSICVTTYYMINTVPSSRCRHILFLAGIRCHILLPSIRVRQHTEYKL